MDTMQSRLNATLDWANVLQNARKGASGVMRKLKKVRGAEGKEEKKNRTSGALEVSDVSRVRSVPVMASAQGH